MPMRKRISSAMGRDCFATLIFGSSHVFGSSSSSRGSSTKEASTGKLAPHVFSKWVLIDGSKYTTLAWYLGKTPVKSQKALAAHCAADGRIQLRHGGWKTLDGHFGKEILPSSARNGFRDHRWVDTVCRRAERFASEALQVRLLPANGQTTSKVFLLSVAQLVKCKSLKLN